MNTHLRLLIAVCCLLVAQAQERPSAEIRKINGTNYNMALVRAALANDNSVSPALRARYGISDQFPELAWKNIRGTVVARTSDGIIIRDRKTNNVTTSETYAPQPGNRLKKVAITTEREVSDLEPVLVVNLPNEDSLVIGSRVDIIAMRAGQYAWKASKNSGITDIERYDHGTPPTAEEYQAARQSLNQKAEEKKRRADEAVRKFREEQAAKNAAEFGQPAPSK